MAIIQYTAIVNQIRGKLNGSVFNKSRNGYTLQRKQQPTHKQSSLQSRRRSVFAQAQRRWKELTPLQQNGAQVSSNSNPTKDRFGQQVRLAGYNHFVKANIISLLHNQQFIDDLKPDPADPYNYVFMDATISITQFGDGIRFTGQSVDIDIADENTQGITFFIYASKPISNGVTSYGGRWYLGSSFHINKNSGLIGLNTINFPDSLTQNYPVFESGQRVLIKLDAWNMVRGALVNSQIFSITL